MAAPAASIPATTAAPVTSSVPTSPTHKVFVGNLSFKTREGELQKAFQGAGNVLSANIITRGPRSLGYGFVEFATEVEANKAVTLMNKRELDGREINVEVAKNRDDLPLRAPAATGGALEGGMPHGGRGGRGGSRGGYLRRRGGAEGLGAPAVGGVGAPAAVGGLDGGHINGGAPRGRGGRGGRGGGRGGAAGVLVGVPAAAGGAPAGGRPPRGERPERPERSEAPSAPRTQSATTLFVANLPFSVDNKGLHEIFQGYNPSAAHVVTKRNGRSKGFGFVEFKSADDQNKALAAVDKKQVQGRELIVKIALTDQVHHEAKAEHSPAAGSPAVAPAVAVAAAPAAAGADKK